MSQQEGTVHHQSPPQAKIALFRSLFRGRDDVYPRRFENRKTGKSGYAPACGDEWVISLCEKPRIKCAACLNQNFLPVTDEAVRWHLSGQDGSGDDFVERGNVRRALSALRVRIFILKRSPRPVGRGVEPTQKSRKPSRTCRSFGQVQVAPLTSPCSSTRFKTSANPFALFLSIIVKWLPAT